MNLDKRPIPGLAEHFARSRSWVARLRATGRTDPVVIGLLLTESFFRTRADRVAEYLAWICLSVVWPSRVRRLSVGIAQIQVRHWMRLDHWDSFRISPLRLWRTLREETNYDACNRLMPDEVGQMHVPAQRVAAAYRGEARSYHLRVFERSIDFARGASEPPG